MGKLQKGVFRDKEERDEAIFIIYLVINFIDRNKINRLLSMTPLKGITKMKRALSMNGLSLSNERLRQIIMMKLREQINENNK